MGKTAKKTTHDDENVEELVGKIVTRVEEIEHRYALGEFRYQILTRKRRLPIATCRLPSDRDRLVQHVREGEVVLIIEQYKPTPRAL